MNAITLLKQDHNNVENLFTRYEQLDGDVPAVDKREIVDKILEQLSVHAAIEEQLLYPAVREKAAGAKGLVLEALEEHHVVKVALSELEKLQPVFERFDAKVHVLIENVRHHVREEEEELFPQVREAFTVQELESLGEAMEAAKKTAPTRPHPFQPDVPPLNVILGAPVAVVDRVITLGKDVVNRALSRS